MDPITIHSKLTAEDYKRAVAFGSFQKNKLTIPFFCIASIIGLVQILTAWTTGRVDYPITFYSSLVMFGLMALTLVIFIWNTNRFIKSDKVSFDVTRTVYIEENGIVSLAPSLDKTSIAYGDFYKAYEINGYFLLYINNLQAVILAKRDINAEKIPIIRQVFQQSMGSKFQIRSMK